MSEAIQHIIPPVVDSFIESTIEYEIRGTTDGWIHLPGDSGGQTMWGLSANNNPQVAEKIKNRTLTKAEAKMVYYRKYYQAIPLIGLLDQRLAYFVFDSYVHGAYVPILILQEWINKNHGPKLVEDGVIGRKTMEAAMRLTFQEVSAFLAEFKSKKSKIADRMAKNTMAVQRRKGLRVVDYSNGFLSRLSFRISTSYKKGDEHDGTTV